MRNPVIGPNALKPDLLSSSDITTELHDIVAAGRSRLGLKTVRHDESPENAANPESGERFLTQEELADRWRISPRTLERWRYVGCGPQFMKLGGVVRYDMEHIKAFEQQRNLRR
jgi:hypothetical protein